MGRRCSRTASPESGRSAAAAGCGPPVRGLPASVISATLAAAGGDRRGGMARRGRGTTSRRSRSSRPGAHGEVRGTRPSTCGRCPARRRRSSRRRRRRAEPGVGERRRRDVGVDLASDRSGISRSGCSNAPAMNAAPRSVMGSAFDRAGTYRLPERAELCRSAHATAPAALLRPAGTSVQPWEVERTHGSLRDRPRGRRGHPDALDASEAAAPDLRPADGHARHPRARRARRRAHRRRRRARRRAGHQEGPGAGAGVGARQLRRADRAARHRRRRPRRPHRVPGRRPRRHVDGGGAAGRHAAAAARDARRPGHRAPRQRHAATLITSVLDDPTGYGRVVRPGEDGRRPGAAHRRAARRDGRRACGPRGLHEHVRVPPRSARPGAAPPHPDNAQGEYYLTDVVGSLAAMGHRIGWVEATAEETQGVNDRWQLALAERELRNRTNRAVAAQRGHHARPAPDVHRRHRVARAGRHPVPGHDPAGHDVDRRRLRDRARHPPRRLHGRRGSVVEHTVGRDSEIGAGARVGPFAHLGAGSSVPEGAVTGAFYTAPTD